MQTSEFIKSQNFGNYLKKTAKKPNFFSFFHLKIDFYGYKNIFLHKLGSILIDKPDISDETIRNQNFPFSRKS